MAGEEKRGKTKEKQKKKAGYHHGLSSLFLFYRCVHFKKQCGEQVQQQSPRVLCRT